MAKNKKDLARLNSDPFASKGAKRNMAKILKQRALEKKKDQPSSHWKTVKGVKYTNSDIPY